MLSEGKFTVTSPTKSGRRSGLSNIKSLIFVESPLLGVHIFHCALVWGFGSDALPTSNHGAAFYEMQSLSCCTPCIIKL